MNNPINYVGILLRFLHTKKIQMTRSLRVCLCYSCIGLFSALQNAFD